MTSSPTPLVTTIHLDAIHLDELCDFYAELLGYRVVRTENLGMITESRTLESDAYPAVRLVLRNCLPRPPVGSALGTIRLLEFEVEDPARAASRVKDPRWVSEPPREGESPDRLILLDSTGYRVALARRPAGSACDAGSPA